MTARKIIGVMILTLFGTSIAGTIIFFLGWKLGAGVLGGSLLVSGLVIYAILLINEE